MKDIIDVIDCVLREFIQNKNRMNESNETSTGNGQSLNFQFQISFSSHIHMNDLYVLSSPLPTLYNDDGNNKKRKYSCTR